ncbi:nuclear inhibitor of protein phosphatase 1 isoform X1 [Tachypleus tridentatus]|uniref:nuclear inhibitor of protein phosphatase 1 isoform X1 n=2 Tax=Tachypleus tridentatus TaxID=6853 RepID=UPI003FD55CE0
MANHYDIPKWAGKPPVGLHLDVMKGDKLIQNKGMTGLYLINSLENHLTFRKLMIDEKKCYLFGRNPEINDFVIDHASCSRVHSALVYHQALDRAFLVDLGSTHGTYIGRTRLEANKPTQLPVGTLFHFGASTRSYILRERPEKTSRSAIDGQEKKGEDIEGGLLGLPETETELDNLTEFNTAHNRRISMLGIPDEEIKPPNRKRKSLLVKFNEDEEIINPEDVDPSIGRFRNLIQTAVIPHKKQKVNSTSLDQNLDNVASKAGHVWHDHLHRPGHGAVSPLFSPSLSAKLGLHLPNPAPEVDLAPPTEAPIVPASLAHYAPGVEPETPSEPKKKKYAKEAWPGKKPTPSLLV